jgi:hypothetical protein
VFYRVRFIQRAAGQLHAVGNFADAYSSPSEVRSIQIRLILKRFKAERPVVLRRINHDPYRIADHFRSREGTQQLLQDRQVLYLRIEPGAIIVLPQDYGASGGGPGSTVHSHR